MIPRWLAAACLLLTLVPARAAQTDAFEYGPRPPVPLFDPTSYLTPDEAAEIVDPLKAILKKDGIDVFVVVIPDLGEAPPEYVARRFARAWCHPDVNAIVLHCPGRRDGPWIVPGGVALQLLQPQAVEKAITEAEKRAAREPYESGKIRAATTEAADLLRLWTGKLVTHGEQMHNLQQTMISQRQSTLQRYRYLAIALGAALIPSLIGIGWLIRRSRQQAPRRFPEPAWSRRLGAPYCGGNAASVSLESSSSHRQP